jgi:uncharacterized membrane protein YbhN (UPF0104 family)
MGKLASLLTGLRPVYLAAAVVLILGYTGLQLVQWLYLLDHLGIVAPRRDASFAFVGGNLTKYLPGGSYFQNYLLYETSRVDPALSFVATTLMVLLEPAVGLILLFVIGIDGWVWLRWLLGIGLPLALLFAAGLYLFIESPVLPRWLTNRRLYAAVADQVVRFRDGLGRIARPRVLVTTVGLSAALVLLEGLALYMVARALRIDSLSITAALAAYYFSIGVALIVPIFTNLGTLEAGGVAALIALGVSREGAVAVMVLDRALIIALAIVLAMVTSLAFRDLLGRALRAA